MVVLREYDGQSVSVVADLDDEVFEANVDVLRNETELWATFNTLREQIAKLDNRTVAAQTFAKVLRNVAKPGKEARIAKKIERLEAQKAKLQAELQTA